MRICTFLLTLSIFCGITAARAQNGSSGTPKHSNNIYTIREQYMEQLMNNNDREHENDEADSKMSIFNRWFNLMEPRCYPSGEMPAPSALLNLNNPNNTEAMRTTATVVPKWYSLGPSTVPAGFDGIGRIDCIVIDPVDSNRIYVGTACGGVWCSRNGGATWSSSSDNFPSLSVADIAINPRHRDTMYAATGDGYGYVNGSFGIFWGGLYSAGVMKSTDTGHTWATTGLSYLQGQNIIIQKLLIHPTKPNILLAATTNGICRTTDAGAHWDTVSSGHVFSMAFHPLHPDTIYAVNYADLIVSTDAGATWHVVTASINATGGRCSIAVSDASPKSVWILDDNNNLQISHDEGNTFTPSAASPSSTASFYGYYDRVLAVSPRDTNFVVAAGLRMANTTDGGSTWASLDMTGNVHPDNHVFTFSALHPNTVYSGNDGGIFVSHDLGRSWNNISNGLAISQIYRISSSRQNSSMMLCGLQDNGSFNSVGTTWQTGVVPLGDGMDNAIHPKNDTFQIASTQNGRFYASQDRGNSFTPTTFTPPSYGVWTAPVAYNPLHADTVYYGLTDFYASYDGGLTAAPITVSGYSTTGTEFIAVAPSNPHIIYAGDFSQIMKSTDAGANWSVISGSLPSGPAITRVAVDYNNPLKIYATFSGYLTGTKVYKSTDGGTTWTNFSTGIPNIPVNCVAVDSTTPGAVYIGTDIGVYYTDSASGTWAPYGTGLPNVIVDDIDINFTDSRLKAATYGRGVWDIYLKKAAIKHVAVNGPIAIAVNQATLSPNPTTNVWHLNFSGNTPTDFNVTVTDMHGRTIQRLRNANSIDASNWSKGMYFVEITTQEGTQTIKAVKE